MRGGGSARWDVGRAAKWGGSLMDCTVTSRSAIYGGGAADERGAVNRPAGGVFHTELAFMKNTGTALPTAPPGPPWRMEKDAWQASSLFVNLNCSRSLTPEGNFAETAGPAKGEGEEGWRKKRRRRGGEGKGQRGTPEGYLDLCIWPKWLALSWEGDKSDRVLLGCQVEGRAARLPAHSHFLLIDWSRDAPDARSATAKPFLKCRPETRTYNPDCVSITKS